MRITLIGHAGTGKDTAATYLQNRYGFQVTSFYEPLRILSAKLGCGADRRRLNALGHALSDSFGRDLFIWWCQAQLCGKQVIKDARFKNEIEWLRTHSSVVVYIKVPLPVAFERMRRRKRKGDPISALQLAQVWKQEGELDKVRFEDACVIDNSSDKKHLFDELDRIIKAILAQGS